MVKREARSDETASLEAPRSISALARACRLSRATLRYYEKIGILRAGDRAQDGKGYGPEGSRRLSDAITLRNIGFTPEEMLPLLDDDPLCPRHIAEYRQLLEQRVLSLQAQSECLGLQARLVERENDTWVEDVSTYRFNPTMPLDPEVQDSVTREEPMYLPISNGMGLFRGDDRFLPHSLLWGRGVAERHAATISGFGDELPRVGGCTCLCAVLRTDASSGLDVSPEEMRACFSRLRSFACHERLTATQGAFVPYLASANGSQYLAICLPVKRERRRWPGFRG